MTIKERLLKTFHKRAYRRQYVDDLTNSFLATQIQVLREQRELSQEKLAELAGVRQSQISKLEDIDNASFTGKTLKKLAKAFDLRLVVRFESFGSALSEIESMERSALERPSFGDDPLFSGDDRSQLEQNVASVLKAKFSSDRMQFSRDVPDVA